MENKIKLSALAIGVVAVDGYLQRLSKSKRAPSVKLESAQVLETGANRHRVRVTKGGIAYTVEIEELSGNIQGTVSHEYTILCSFSFVDWINPVITLQ